MLLERIVILEVSIHELQIVIKKQLHTDEIT